MNEMLNDFPLKAWKDEAVLRMNALNAKIDEVEGLSSAYHIELADFFDLERLYNGDFDQLWKNHLEGLFREHMHEMQDVDDKIDKLKNIFYKPIQIHLVCCG